ncbi:MAG: TetR/AcrR family transcriptional regulator [Myxococcota bacterium]
MSNNPSAPRSSTAERALVCLEELALDKGLDSVSMRDVAKRLGISLAALQYHYPVKADLIAAFIASAVEAYRRHLEAIMTSPRDGPRLPEVVRAAVRENRAAAGAGSVLAMIEGRAQHDPATASALRAAMQVYLQMLSDVIVGDHPELSAEEAMGAAAMVIALVEGVPASIEAAEGLGIDPEALLEATVDTAVGVVALVQRRSGR